MHEYGTCFFKIDFIFQVSPEVTESTPSILFLVNNIEEMYSKLKEVAHFVGGIQEMGQNKIFNFQTVNGIYMAFSE